MWSDLQEGRRRSMGILCAAHAVESGRAASGGGFSAIRTKIEWWNQSLEPRERGKPPVRGERDG